jgi:four helix bundle protein
MGKFLAFDELAVYQLASRLSDEIRKIIVSWDFLAKDTVGKQLIRAADSIGANVAEGTGLGSFQVNAYLTSIGTHNK